MAWPANPSSPLPHPSLPTAPPAAFGPWTPRIRIFSMSAVRLGPVTITNSPAQCRIGRPRPQPPAQAAGRCSANWSDPGNHHARRRQVAQQPVLGRGAGHQARAGVGQRASGSITLAESSAICSAASLPLSGTRVCPTHHARRQIGRRLADHRPVHRADRGPAPLAANSASRRLASFIVAAADHFAMDRRQFLGELFGHRGRRRAPSTAKPRPTGGSADRRIFRQFAPHPLQNRVTAGHGLYGARTCLFQKQHLFCSFRFNPWLCVLNIRRKVEHQSLHDRSAILDLCAGMIEVVARNNVKLTP